jgi:hypothetical protein
VCLKRLFYGSFDTARSCIPTMPALLDSDESGVVEFIAVSSDSAHDNVGFGDFESLASSDAATSSATATSSAAATSSAVAHTYSYATVGSGSTGSESAKEIRYGAVSTRGIPSTMLIVISDCSRLFNAVILWAVYLLSALVFYTALFISGVILFAVSASVYALWFLTIVGTTLLDPNSDLISLYILFVFIQLAHILAVMAPFQVGSKLTKGETILYWMWVDLVGVALCAVTFATVMAGAYIRALIRRDRRDFNFMRDYNSSAFAFGLIAWIPAPFIALSYCYYRRVQKRRFAVVPSSA